MKIFGDLVRVAVAIVVVGLIGLCLMYYAAVVHFTTVKLHMNDFGKFYYSTRLYLDGSDMHGPTPATEIPVSENEERQLWNMNPPHVHLMLLPMAFLAPANALAVWGLTKLVALAIALRVITLELHLSWTPAGTLWALLFALVNSATGAVIVTGQLTFVLLLGLTVAWREARQGRWIRAALWLGFLASVKPFLGVFGLYFVIRRMWPAAAAMACAAILCFAIGLAIFGASAYVSWIHAVQAASWAWLPMNASLAGFFSRSLSPAVGGRWK